MACYALLLILALQPALGSVPRSVNDPITTNAANVSGLSNVEDVNGKPLSFYAAVISKWGAAMIAAAPRLPKTFEQQGL